MNKEDLNTWIAEKLMGWENKEFGCAFGGGNYTQLVCPDNYDEELPNYFTEGWEQVEKRLAEMHICTTTIFCGDIVNVGLCHGDGDIDYMMEGPDREVARYEVFKWALPDIKRRLEL